MQITGLVPRDKVNIAFSLREVVSRSQTRTPITNKNMYKTRAIGVKNTEEHDITHKEIVNEKGNIKKMAPEKEPNTMATHKRQRARRRAGITAKFSAVRDCRRGRHNSCKKLIQSGIYGDPNKNVMIGKTEVRRITQKWSGRTGKSVCSTYH